MRERARRRGEAARRRRIGSLGRAPARDVARRRSRSRCRRRRAAAARARRGPALAPRRAVRQRRPQVPVDGARGDRVPARQHRQGPRDHRAGRRVVHAARRQGAGLASGSTRSASRSRARGAGCASSTSARSIASTSICAARPTGEIAITPDMIHLPSGLTITSISPRTVRVAFDKPRREDRRGHAAVSPAARSTATSSPRSSRCRRRSRCAAPRARSRALTAIRTREISLEGRTDSFVAETEVVPPDGVEVDGSPQVVGPGRDRRGARHPQAARRSRSPCAAMAIRRSGASTPAQVDVTLTGALLAVEKAQGRDGADRQARRRDGKPREVDGHDRWPAAGHRRRRSRRSASSSRP